MKALTFSRKRVESFVCLMAVALLFGGLTLTKLKIGIFSAMGPGFYPLVLSVVLAGLALVILFQPDAEGEPTSAGDLRPFLAICAGVIIFAVLVQRVGLFPATAAAVIVSATGHKGFAWLPTILLGIGAGAFCTIVFIFGLSLPIPAFRSPF